MLLPALGPALLGTAKGVGHPFGPLLRSALRVSVASEWFYSLFSRRARLGEQGVSTTPPPSIADQANIQLTTLAPQAFKRCKLPFAHAKQHGVALAVALFLFLIGLMLLGKVLSQTLHAFEK